MQLHIGANVWDSDFSRLAWVLHISWSADCHSEMYKALKGVTPRNANAGAWRQPG